MKPRKQKTGEDLRLDPEARLCPAFDAVGVGSSQPNFVGSNGPIIVGNPRANFLKMPTTRYS